jgi:mono/diheme cytochrome c family protein
MSKFRWLAAMLLLNLPLAAHSINAQADAMIDLKIGGVTRTFTQTALLTRPDIVDVTVPHDASYPNAMHYRAVPLADLMNGLTLPADSVLEALASDGFAAQLPMDLVANRNPATAVAYVAVEDPSHPWPKLAGKQVSAGPFYLIWAGKTASSIRDEQWPYQIAHLATRASVVKRWPALAVDASLPATDPVRAGQNLFITECLACHRLNGAGSADVGPDLNLPMNPTEYFQPAALHRYIRNPASVRHWPKLEMPAFGPQQLSDREIDLIIGYLGYMSHRKMDGGALPANKG